MEPVGAGPARMWRRLGRSSRPPRSILLLLLLPIGDTLFATPTVRALRRTYPRARIVVLAYPTNAGILAANPDIDRLILHPTATNWPGWRGYARFLWMLNRSRYDLLVQFGPAQWWLTQLVRPWRRRRMAFPLWQWFLPGGARPWRWRHAITSYATLLTPVERTALPAAPVLMCTDQDRESIVPLLASCGAGPIIALHPGGEGFRDMKRWPVERFIVLAKLLRARHNAQLVILGGAEERALAIGIQAAVPGARALAGRLSLGQTVAVLERSLLFVGNDSAPMHFAAILGVPTVGIFGPTDRLNFRPLGRRAHVVTPELACSPCFHFVGSHPFWAGSRCRVPSCLQTISVGAVLRAAQDAVDG